MNGPGSAAAGGITGSEAILLRYSSIEKTPVQMVIGCVHDRDAITRRAVPIRLEAIPNNGTATWAGVAPAPCAARATHSCHGVDKVSTGNSDRSPRRSSRIDQSGSSQL